MWAGAGFAGVLRARRGEWVAVVTVSAAIAEEASGEVLTITLTLKKMHSKINSKREKGWLEDRL